MVVRVLKYLSLIVLLFSIISAWAVAKDGKTSKRLTTEQLITSMRSIKHPSLQPAASNESFYSIKCGFGIQAQVINRWKEFTQAQRDELSELMKADVLQTDTIAGHFHIFYDTTGSNEPALLDNNNQRIPGTAKAYINFVAQIFNHVWDVEIESLKYAAPPLDSDSLYDVYVEDLGNGNYGGTTPVEPQLNGTGIPPRYRSYVSVDNDFQGTLFYTHGINALEVTAAHEFHHVIQIGSYGYWEDDIFAHELTSVWMEDVVYTDVNDYYQYCKDYFGDANRDEGFWQGLSFNSDFTNGYERCFFAHCIAKIYGVDIMREIWTSMRTQPFLESANAAFMNHGSNLPETFEEFTKWNYFTADRADTIHYYPEGNHYPRFQPLQQTAFYNATSTVSGGVEPLSSSMYEFDASNDTITAIIANIDTNDAINKNTTLQNIDVTLSYGLPIKISVDNPSFWILISIDLNNRFLACN